MTEYRLLTELEVTQLTQQHCSAECWERVWVASNFIPDYVQNVQFSGDIHLGVFEKELTLLAGIRKHTGIRNAVLHNVAIGDNCLIENIHNYIANYTIGEDTIIENVDLLVVNGKSTFGNGVPVSVMDETGGRQVCINDKLSAHMAYIMALYRHRPALAEKLKGLTDFYTNKHASCMGTIGREVQIHNTGCIQNVKIGDFTHICGACKLKNGSINGNELAPVKVGNGVICTDFIISSGSRVTDGTMLTRCFVGQSCILGHGYTASDSLFFSNCQGENGEACAILAGPFTVSHHKSTLLIAGMFSFMNAGSGSNQSNHMYKLGPIHQGTMERGSKTTSDSYVLWPARIGAFSLVMGRHVDHVDSTNLPFSYLIEQKGTTYIVPGVNLKSVGTIRDVQKWPKRDNRTDSNYLDYINYNLLSPYTVQKMFKGIDLLKNLQQASGEWSDIYSYRSAKITNSALKKGIVFYEMAIHKFLGNSLIKRLEAIPFRSNEEIQQRLLPDLSIGLGEWVDVAGLIAPKTEVDKLLEGIEENRICKLKEVNAVFGTIHKQYYTYEWTWAYEKIQEFYQIDLKKITAKQVVELVGKWKDAVVGLDKMLYEDAKKEFSLSFMTGFGADGTSLEQQLDFEQVRGAFENNPFVQAVTKHIEVKTALGDELIERLIPLI